MLDFIVNPLAGGKNGKVMNKNLSLVSNYLSEKQIPFTIHKTEYKGHGKILTEELIKNGSTDIIAMGGDGTLHEVINGFSNFERVTLGILPCGTGNDFAFSLGLPTNVLDALKIVLDKNTVYTDFLQLPTLRCLNVAGMGMDVDVLNRYEKLKKKTKFGYTKCLLKTLFKFDHISFTATINGKTEELKSYIACIANGVCFGGGLKVCPVANVSDGLLDFITVEKMGKLRLINALLKLKAGKILTIREAKHQTASEVEIKTNGDYFVNLDGELYKNIPFSLKVISNTLKVYR